MSDSPLRMREAALPLFATPGTLFSLRRRIYGSAASFALVLRPCCW